MALTLHCCRHCDKRSLVPFIFEGLRIHSSMIHDLVLRKARSATDPTPPTLGPSAVLGIKALDEQIETAATLVYHQLLNRRRPTNSTYSHMPLSLVRWVIEIAVKRVFP